MASNGTIANASDIANPDMQKFIHEGLPYNSEDDVELQNALKVSSEVDMTLAYCSEKLANLENLLLLVLAGENDIEAIHFENDDFSPDFIEKAFALDLLYTMLNLELRELDDLTTDIQDLIVDALSKIYSCEHSTELLTGVARKLQDSEDLLKQSQERVLEMKIQLAKLQMTSFIFKQNKYKFDLDKGVKGELNFPATEWKRPTVEQRRVLRMLEKSLARELELEKKLTEFRRNEEDLKLKIRLTEQVAVCMEEAAEVAWGRFLEADNTAEVFMGISKEMSAKIQMVLSNLRSSTIREEELKSQLQNCITQLNENETSIKKLNTTIAELITDNAEVSSLRERVGMLEEKLGKTETLLTEANASNDTSQQQIKAMESELESLRENVCNAETRAESAEEKVTHLTESNHELTEEIDFLKTSNDSNAKKVSLLEKQLRDFDIQLQHSRASSEASQEQQNMLYTAIWDMETLIDELKQKVAKAESNSETAEERCVILSDTNSELNKEIEFLRSRMDVMETSLDKAAIDKRSCAKDISMRTSLIADMVMELAKEREHIQKKMASLTKENKLLREKLRQGQKNASSVVLQDNGSHDDKKFPSSVLDSGDDESAKCVSVNTAEISSESFQVEQKSAMYASLNENVTEFSNSTSLSTNSELKPETESLLETGKNRRTYIFVATFVLLLSILAAHLFHKRLYKSENFVCKLL